MSYTNKEQQLVEHPPTDGSELIAIEVQANTHEKDVGESLDAPLRSGYTVDEEGHFNNYAIEPEMYKAEYPSPKQQRYIFVGAAAILFVALVLWIAFEVS